MFKAISDSVVKGLKIAAVPTTQLHDEKNVELIALKNSLTDMQSDISETTSALSPAGNTKKAITSISQIWQVTNSRYACQGGCTDGTYIYNIENVSSSYITETSAATLRKRSIAGTLVKTNSSVVVYHGNDLTYNENTGFLYCATMYKPTDSSSTVKVFDVETLAELETITVPYYISAIAYNPIMDLYVGAAGNKNIYLFRLNYDETTQTHTYVAVKTLSVDSSPCYEDGYSSQGIACDGAFIYHAWSYGGYARIELFDYFGNYRGQLYYNAGYEVEWIDTFGENFYLGFHVLTSDDSYVRTYKFTLT